MNPSHNLSLISFLLFWYEARQDIEDTRSIQLGTPGRKLAYGNKCLLQVNQQGSSYCFYSWMEDDSKTSKIEYNMIFMSIRWQRKEALRVLHYCEVCHSFVQLYFESFTNTANVSTQKMKTTWIKCNLTSMLLWIIVLWIITLFLITSAYFSKELQLTHSVHRILNNLEVIQYFFHLYSLRIGIMQPHLNTIF